MTVFNNDKDGSAGLGVGTDSEYSETSAGKTIAFDTVNARYARFYSNGSTVNGGNHYVEIEVYGSEPMKTEVRTETTTENIVDYTTINTEDNTLKIGETELIQGGFNGYDTVIYEVTYINGVETGRVETTRTTTAPVEAIVRVGTQITEVKSEIATENEIVFTTVEEEDSTILTGERVVVQSGVNGNDTVTYDVTYVNGIETNRVEVSRMTIAPVAEVIKIGTQVTEIKSETTTENEVAYVTVEADDNTIPTGEHVVVKAGLKGYDTITYDVTYVNGVETNRMEISRVTTAPVSEIVKVGTKVTEVKSETTIENEVAYATVEEDDNTIPTGQRVVFQTGLNGYDTVTYDVTYVNGVETNRVEAERETTAPVNEIIKVGTQVTEVKSETTTENESAFTTVEEFDNTIPTGERVVVQDGVVGYDTVTYDVTYVNGIETNRVEISRATTAPVSEIVKLGTQVTEVKTETTTENESAFTTVEEFDNTIPTGERVVVQAGVKGYDTVTFDVTYVNGVETNRVEVSRVTTAPVAEIVKVGTQVTKVKSETNVENEATFTTVEETDNTIPTGERVVVQVGVKGYDTVTYDVTYVNGIETNRVEVSRKTTAPIAEVIKVGTQVTEVKSETTTENEVVFTTVEEEDNTIPTGERVVVQTGLKGYDTVTYDVTYVNGVETNRMEVSRASTAPVSEIVKVGTQVTEVKSESAIENEVDFTTVEEFDNTIPTGERIVVQEGVDGYDTVTYDVTYVNGIETNRVEVSRTTTVAVAKIIKVGMQVTEVTQETTTENEVDFATVEEEDNTIPTGERVVVKAGVKGYDTVRYDVTYVNGIETNQVETSRVTTAPVSEIVKVGTQVTEVKSETITENEVVFATLEEEDNTIPTGERVVVQAGVQGYDTVSYNVTYVNGIETNQVEVSRSSTAPVSEIVKVGTQVTEFKSETNVENEVVFITVEEEDNTIPTGERIVVQVGENGYDTVTYDVTYVNGIETKCVEISRVTTSPVSAIVKVGTQVTEVKSETTTENEVAYATVEEEANTIPIGERVVVQAGVNGYDVVTHEVTYVNGIEINSIEVSRTTIAAVNEIIKVGTKISVEDIVVTSDDEDSIILNGSTLQMTASISPDDATATEVTWSVEEGTGIATIDNTGLLTAMSAGTVTVKAMAK